MLLFFKKEVLPYFLSLFLFTPQTAQAQADPPRALSFGDGGITSLAWSPDGTYVAACAMANACRVWNAASGKVLATAPGIGPADQLSDGMAFSADGRSLLVPAPGGLTVWGWAAGAAPRLAAFPAPFTQEGNGFDGLHHCGPAGLIESTGDSQGSWVLRLDARDFHITHKVKLPGFGVDNSCLPDGSAIIRPQGGPQPASVLRMSDGQAVATLNARFGVQPSAAKFQVTAAAASPNGKIIALGAELIDDVQTPDGNWVAEHAPYAVRLVSWPENQDVGGLFPNNNYVFTLSFSPDSQYLAAALDKQVVVQRIAPASPARALTPPSDGFTPIAFSPKANILAVGDGSRVLLFDLSSLN